MVSSVGDVPRAGLRLGHRTDRVASPTGRPRPGRRAGHATDLGDQVRALGSDARLRRRTRPTDRPLPASDQRHRCRRPPDPGEPPGPIGLELVARSPRPAPGQSRRSAPRRAGRPARRPGRRLRSRRRSISSTSQLVGQPGRLGAVLVGVAEDADRVELGGRQEVASAPRRRASVSPGKPQMTLLRIPAVGASCRIESIRPRNASGSPNRRIRRSTAAPRAGRRGRSRARPCRCRP